jgi:xylan 1,4-beta-xylosidase
VPTLHPRPAAAALALAFAAIGCAPAWGAEELVVDAAAPRHPFAHAWEQMFGSGRAILALRDAYRQDLRSVKAVTDLQYVRFHAILHDEVGVYGEDKQGRPVYNFSYVDQIYDGLLAEGVRPFVELSFMPRQLAARPLLQEFWYHPNISPPKDYARWDALIRAFAAHLVERYGIDEVGRWYFEVWNEPNIGFWGGEPAQASYWTLYDHTARALKAVDARLRVGGPSTAQAAWVDEFIRHCADKGVPVDFVSTHVYANDTAEDVFGLHEAVPRDAMVCRAAGKVRAQVSASPRPQLPIIWSEYNATFYDDPAVTDAPFMGPWLADTLRQCDGLADMMSYWTFSDVFEEQGVVKTPFHGGFGLIAAGGIPKPAFNAFAMLHTLGTERLDVDSTHALVTRREDGTLVIALWNYRAPAGTAEAATIVLRLRNSTAETARVQRLDAAHGDVHAAYARMGSPASPTAAQLQTLRAAAALPAPERVTLAQGSLALTLPPDGLVTIEIPAP